jgi:hypothetical protein
MDAALHWIVEVSLTSPGIRMPSFHLQLCQLEVCTRMTAEIRDLAALMAAHRGHVAASLLNDNG